MEQSFHGYKFDGDPEGLKFLARMTEEEISTIVKAVNYLSKANIMDDRHSHLEITKSSEGIFMVSEISVNSSWF